ncbi:hypothetical protein B0T13DRAFT_486066 [Neurospora crassa]|nr:hypothetical protein B0T13DRAFT_486066 [Neurospora crassa]
MANSSLPGPSRLDSSKFGKHSPSPIVLNINDVVADLNIYKRFCLPSLAPGVQVTELPNFDDITRYEVRADVQEGLWNLEATRLVNAVTRGVLPRFQGSADLEVSDSKITYAALADLAEKMMQCLSIVSHDRECLLMKYHEPSFDSDKLEESEGVLRYLLKKSRSNGSGQNQRGEAQRHASMSNIEDFFVFVDYCTAVLARYLCSAVEGNSVHINIIAHIARIAAKIKTVSADLRTSAERSLKYQRRVELYDDSPDGDTIEVEIIHDHDYHRPHQHSPEMVRIKPTLGYTRAPSRPHPWARDGKRPRSPSPPRLQTSDSDILFGVGVATKKTELRILYHEKCHNYHWHLVELLQGLLSHLRGTQGTQISSPFFEICGMGYETGFERFRTLVFQDEKHNFLGTSDTHIVNYARNAFHLLNQAIISLQVHTEGIEDSNEASTETTITWMYAPDKPDIGPLKLSGNHRASVRLRSMSNIITVLVPLVLANPSILSCVSGFYGRIAFDKHMRVHSSLSSGTNDHQLDDFKRIMYRKYIAYFSVSTKKYCRQQQRLRNANGPRSLSNALMRNNYLYAGDKQSPYSRVRTMTVDSSATSFSTNSAPPLIDDQSALGRVESRREELDRVGERMKSWVFEETGVMVKCKTYVALTMFSSIFLAASGLAVGVTLGPRISAVDPFNLTTYCWALAAFVILVAKSVRVHEWSWNDFLHCRVLCKSVSELSSVTGIDEQLILAKLVQTDPTSILETRGPFNQVFDGKKSGDGFSIDRPIGMWAMLLSGLIMIEVESLDGRRLVCLDLRRGTKLRIVENQVKKYFKCLYSKEGQIPDRREHEGLDEEGEGTSNRVQLKRGELTWTRALGLYSNKEAVFV